LAGTAEKLSGMYEASTMVAEVEWRPKTLVKRVLLAANVAPLADYSSGATVDEMLFSGRLLHSQQPVLISLKGSWRPPGVRPGRCTHAAGLTAFIPPTTEPLAGKTRIAVNCEDTLLCPTILKAVRLSVTAK